MRRNRLSTATTIVRGTRFFLAAGLALTLASRGSAEPNLMVVVSIDQCRADYLSNYASEFRGGLKVMLDGGAVFTQARLDFIPSETGPGHAAIATGKPPGETGIVGNYWRDRSLGRRVYCVYDSASALGPQHLEVRTLGDVLKARHPEARVVSISLKDRSAVLLAGHAGDLALWYDPHKGGFTTSPHYRRPIWLDGFNESLRSPGGLLAGMDTTALNEVGYTLKADRLVLALAEESIRRESLGRHRTPDLLALSFSGTDYIGHAHGPFSPEIREQLLNVDGVLGELLSAIESAARPGRFDVALTADHGVAPMPESAQGKALGVRRIIWDAFHDSLEAALKARFKAPGPWIVGREYPNLYLNRAQAESLGYEWRKFLALASRALKSSDGVAEIYVPGDLPATDPYVDMVRRSIMPGRSGDLIARVAPNVVVTDRPTGTDHGTPYDYDCKVPLVFYGPDFKPGRYDAPALMRDLAPTCAAVLQLDLPPEAPSQVRRDVLK
jgi:predicted AlkP superfamily pyrophosphatase or phosphodiesterase